ncbi:MAG: hypothetical protein LUD72_14280 [Bacteroidales bacterium]|nr:hypothetical protein [Bacteroidales bacterium]
MKNKVTRIICIGISLTMVLTVVLGCVTFLAGCASKKSRISKVEINNLDIYYLPTSTIDFDSVTITVTYDDDTVEEMKIKEFDISDKYASDGTEFVLNTDGLYGMTPGELKEGSYDLSCIVLSEGYKSGTIMTVTVGENYGSDLTPLFYDDPEFITTYKRNLELHTGIEGEEDSFCHAPDGYFVGDDNAFTFKPVLYVTNKKGKIGTFSDYDRDISVTLLDEDTNAAEDPLNLENNDYVAVNGFNFDFTENAIGKSFRIEVSVPYGFSATEFVGDFEAVSMDVTVADGWNVTDATELGRMALVSDSFNRSEYVNGNDEKSARNGSPAEIYWDGEEERHVAKYTSDIWKDFLTEKGCDCLEPVNGIFLHGDITVTQKDLPEDFFVSEEEARHYGVYYDEMVGSVRDGVKIYEKNVEEDFTFDGNLFTVDCTSLKWALTHLSSDFDLDYYTQATTAYRESSIALFGFQGLTSRNTTKERATAVLRNVNAIGNGIDRNDIEGKAAGSVRFVESRSSKTKVDNCIVREYMSGFTAKNSDDGYNNLDIDHTKIYDCYNFALIIAKSAANSVKNSEFKRFSCPAITLMSDTTEKETGDHSYSKAGITIDDNTVIESYLNGTEAWWTTNNAGSVAGYLSDADRLIVVPCTSDVGVAKTILNEDEDYKLNMIGVFQDSEYFGQGGTRLNTYYKYGDGVPYIMNDTVWNSSMSADVTGEELGLYNAAVTNYFIDSGANKTIPMTFVTNQGTLCALNGYSGFYDPLAVAGKSENKSRIPLDENDDQIYIYYDMEGIGLSIIVELYDA